MAAKQEMGKDLTKMSDVEVVRYFFKIDEKQAQKVIDEGINVKFLRGEENIIENNMNKEVDNIISKYEDKAGNVFKDDSTSQ